MITLFFLDDYHLGDPLFLANLGRRLATFGSEGRFVVVHRDGEAKDEKTVRETNQGVARRLIEEGVPAVSIQGSDRGLLVVGESVVASSAAWLPSMVETGTVPVISPLAVRGDQIEAADPVQCAVAIADVLRARGALRGIVFCSTGKAGLFRDGKRIDAIPVADLEPHTNTIDVAAAKGLARKVDHLVATNWVGILDTSASKGTVISP
jgi:acetylglutamate kinase